MKQNRERLTAEERKKKIIKSAIKVFAKSNYRVARVSEIAAGADISEAMLYKHFTSKKEIFLNILQHMSQRIENFTSKVFEEEPDALEILRKALLSYYDQMQTHPDQLKLHFQAISEVNDQEIGDLIKKDHQYYFHFISTVIKKGVSQGSIRNDIEAEPIAWLIDGIGILMNIAQTVSLKKEIDEVTVNKIIDHVIESIKV